MTITYAITFFCFFILGFSDQKSSNKYTLSKMADKLGLGPEIKELRLGSSFTNPRGSAFHTFRCNSEIVLKHSKCYLHSYFNT